MNDLAAAPSLTDSLIEQALADAEVQLGVSAGTPYGEARIVERAIENMVEIDDKLRQAILQLMWRMERDLLYAELGHKDMLSWALSNPQLTRKWSRQTIDRYAKAISRVLPDVFSRPLILPETGEVIGPEELLERASMSAISDYSYTFSQTDDPDARKAMLLSILNHDGEEARDAIIHEIRRTRQPLPSVAVYTRYDQDTVDFAGRCSYEQWQAMSALLGSLIDERFVKPAEDAS